MRNTVRFVNTFFNIITIRLVVGLQWEQLQFYSDSNSKVMICYCWLWSACFILDPGNLFIHWRLYPVTNISSFPHPIAPDNPLFYWVVKFYKCLELYMLCGVGADMLVSYHRVKSVFSRQSGLKGQFGVRSRSRHLFGIILDQWWNILYIPVWKYLH